MNKSKLFFSILATSTLPAQSSTEGGKLIGFDQLINELDQITATDKTYFKRHNKDGSPKYLHQIKQRVYPMYYSDKGNYELQMMPEEWFSVNKLADNEFTVRVLDPLKMWQQHDFKPFTIQWQITEIVD